MVVYRNVLLALLVLCASTTTASDRIRKGPEPLRGGDHGIGQLAPDAKFQDLSDTSYDLAKLASDHEMVVVAMTSTSCPLSLKYFPTLLKLSKEYSRQLGCDRQSCRDGKCPKSSR